MCGIPNAYFVQKTCLQVSSGSGRGDYKTNILASLAFANLPE